MQYAFTITAEDAGSRLDVFLTRQLAGRSRSQVQKLIKDGVVLLNGKVPTPHIALRAGDKIFFELPEAPAAAEGLKPRPDISIPVVYEDDDVLVVDKPSGLLVHPTVRDETDTLANALVAQFPQIAGVGEAPDRPGIMHRLDKDASGLMVVAKDQAAYLSLKKQFQDRTIDKEYSVLVQGRPPKDSGTVSLAIGRAAGGDKMAARSEPMEGDRPAVTHYRVEKLFADASLLTVKTETGRTHQIRAHFKALGCPVAGDPLYKPARGRRLAVARLFLHCSRLAFSHPATGRRLEFRSPLPPDLQKELDKLRPE